MNISSDEQFKPWYISDIKHRYTRRADWHDYSSRCHYMVTFNRNCNYGKPLSRILHAGKTDDGKLNAIASLSKIGMIIHKWIYQAEQTFRVVEIINSVIMPDHVHLVIFFREKADYTHLLKDPCRSPLIVSSRYTQEERERYEAEWDATASVKGVFVSPFISRDEKRLMRQFLDKGARMIKIVEHGFWERFKPSGELFDLCVTGRLLLIGETDDNIRNIDMTRNLALKLNDRARKIAYNDPLIHTLAYGDEDGWRLCRPFGG